MTISPAKKAYPQDVSIVSLLIISRFPFLCKYFHPSRAHAHAHTYSYQRPSPLTATGEICVCGSCGSAALRRNIFFAHRRITRFFLKSTRHL